MILLFTSQRDTITTTSLQRQVSIGYNQARRMLEYMEAQDYVGPTHVASPREVFLTSSDIDFKVKFKTNTTCVELWEKCLRLIRKTSLREMTLGLRLYIFCLSRATILYLPVLLKCMSKYWKNGSLKLSQWQSANIMAIM